MSKFTIIHATDIHIRGTNPKGRVDNYPEAIKAKLREVFALAGKNSNTAIVISGDLFDMPDISDSVAGEFAEILLDCPCPVFVIPGEHDEFNHSLETLYRTKMGLMGKVRILNVLDREPAYLEVAEENENGLCTKFKIQLTGQGRHPDMDTTGEDYMTVEPLDDKTWVVHAAHGALTLEPFFGTHTLISECKTNAHVVLTGHLHNGYGLVSRILDGTVVGHISDCYVDFSVGDTLFSNPGSIARKDATPEDMTRPVQVTVLEFTENEVTATLVPLKCAAPGSEILSRDHIVKQFEREEKMKTFMSLLNQEGERKFQDVQEIAKSVAEMKKIPQDIVDDFNRRLGKAREELGRKRERQEVV